MREVLPMTGRISRRNVLQITVGAAATFGLSAVAAELAPVRAFGQRAPVRSVKDDYKEDFFYREDWLGDRPDLPGLGHSKVPAGFNYSLATLAAFVARALGLP
jgi:hypothetical protein